MKKQTLLIVLLVCLAVAGAAVFARSGRRPFRDLQVADVASATVYLIPPDETVEIRELPELVSCLQEVVVYGKDDSYREYCGQEVTFTLTMADGTQRTVTAYNPFVVIDGVGYRTKYEPCEALNSYANRLLRLVKDA